MGVRTYFAKLEIFWKKCLKTKSLWKGHLWTFFGNLNGTRWYVQMVLSDFCEKIKISRRRWPGYCGIALYTCLKPEIMVQSFFYWFDRKWSLDLQFSSSQDIRRKAGEQNEPSNTVDDPGYGCNRNTQHGFCHVSLLTLCFLEGMCPMICHMSVLPDPECQYID